MIALTVFAIVNEWFFIAFVVALTAGALYEFFYLVKKKEIPIYSYVGIFIGVLIPISIFTKFELTKNWELLFIVLGFLLLLLLQFSRKDNRNAIVGISTAAERLIILFEIPARKAVIYHGTSQLTSRQQ